MRHVALRVEGGDATQPVAVRHLEDEELEVLFSPGLVEGIAAGDVIRLTNSHSGDFEVIRRGGNLSVKIFHASAVAPVVEWLRPKLRPLDARVDGQIERAVVLTVPFRGGFSEIEALMEQARQAFEGFEWYFGNVYDADDRPLIWWR